MTGDSVSYDARAACSTVHRREETPTNTLQLSRCWTLLRTAPAHADPSQIFIFHGSVQRSIGDIAQIECGCFGGPACYWSSCVQSLHSYHLSLSND
jgi:hypothetical protein